MAHAPARILSGASALEWMRVETVDGKPLGRLFDLRCQRGNGPGTLVVTEIVCGRHGLLEHLGLREAQPTTVPWSAVQSIDGNTIVVAHLHRRRRRSARQRTDVRR
jgi:hypothetical protein